jgi:hypothetical protein
MIQLINLPSPVRLDYTSESTLKKVKPEFHTD